jgi:hypothetical protein
VNSEIVKEHAPCDFGFFGMAAGKNRFHLKGIEQTWIAGNGVLSVKLRPLTAFYGGDVM